MYLANFPWILEVQAVIVLYVFYLTDARLWCTASLALDDLCLCWQRWQSRFVQERLLQILLLLFYNAFVRNASDFTRGCISADTGLTAGAFFGWARLVRPACLQTPPQERFLRSLDEERSLVGEVTPHMEYDGHLGNTRAAGLALKGHDREARI